MTDKPTRRDLMKPVHLLGWSFAAALFAGFVTALSTGAFTAAGGDVVAGAWRLAAIVAGIAFIVVVLMLALLLLVVDPREVVEPKDGPVLLRGRDNAAEDENANDAAHGPDSDADDDGGTSVP